MTSSVGFAGAPGVALAAAEADRREVTINFDGRRLLQLATIHRLLGESEREDYVIVLLRGGEIGDWRGDARFAFDRLARSGAARRQEGHSENGKEKTEIGDARFWSWQPARPRRFFSKFHFRFSIKCSG